MGKEFGFVENYWTSFGERRVWNGCHLWGLRLRRERTATVLGSGFCQKQCKSKTRINRSQRIWCPQPSVPNKMLTKCDFSCTFTRSHMNEINRYGWYDHIIVKKRLWSLLSHILSSVACTQTRMRVDKVVDHLSHLVNILFGTAPQPESNANLTPYFGYNRL